MQFHSTFTADGTARPGQRAPPTTGASTSTAIPVSVDGAPLPYRDRSRPQTASAFNEANAGAGASSSPQAAGYTAEANSTPLTGGGNPNGPKPSSDPQPFLKQRRLPSILLDSWEFRKLAAEGSVLANAMVSYDVDDDGVEEVIVGTTEGLLCVVKPDCRAPLFLRVLAATISVVLYTPIQKRLVLVTLEGQCEVIDYFLSPHQQPPPHSSLSRHGRTHTPSGGADSDGYQRSESANSLSRGPANVSHNSSSYPSGASPPPPTTTQQSYNGNPLGGAATTATTTTVPPIPRNRSHTSMLHPMLYEAAQQPSVAPTHVFHVPSNCLCADLSTDTDTDLVFLGSYDRRFYVYSIATGSCLLSLFVHDPITSVKAFTIPTAAAQDRRKATSSSSISVYDRAGRRGSNGGGGGKSRRGPSASPLTRERNNSIPSTKLMAASRSDHSANASTHTVEYHYPSMHADLYVPLVFIATPTHLILLPAGLNEIQQWRKLQPKSAHLPLTVQLHADTPATPSPPPAQSSLSATAAAPTPAGVNVNSSAADSAASATQQQQQRRMTASSGGDASFRPTSTVTRTASAGRARGAQDALHHHNTDRSDVDRRDTAASTGWSSGGAGGRRPLRGGSVPAQREGETPVPPPLSRGAGGLRRGHDDVNQESFEPSSSASMVNQNEAGSSLSNMHHSQQVQNNNTGSRSLSGPIDRSLTAEANPSRAAGNISSSQRNATMSSTAAAAVVAARERGTANAGVSVPLNPESAVPLSTSQQRRQARKRAIQAAEMGKPVLVKPLWALHIGRHTLDVPPLQTSPFPSQNANSASTASTTEIPTHRRSGRSRGSDVHPESASAASMTQRAAVSVSSTHARHGSLNSAGEPQNQQQRSLQRAARGNATHGAGAHTHRHRVHSRRSSSRPLGGAVSRDDSTSLLSLSSPSSPSVLREGSDLLLGSVTQSGENLRGSQSLLQAPQVVSRRGSRQHRESGEATEASTGGGDGGGSIAAARPERQRPPRLQPVGANSGNASRDTPHSRSSTSSEAASQAGDRSGDAEDNDDGVNLGLQRRSSSGGGGAGGGLGASSSSVQQQQRAGQHRLRHRRHSRSRSRVSRPDEPLEGVRFSLPEEEVATCKGETALPREGLRGRGGHAQDRNQGGRISSTNSGSEAGLLEEEGESVDDDGPADDDRSDASLFSSDRSSYCDSVSSDQEGDSYDDGEDDDEDDSSSGASCDQSDSSHSSTADRPSRRSRAGKPDVDATLLAKSLARMRAESVPTTLLRRLMTDSNSNNGGVGGLANGTSQHAPYEDDGVTGRGVGLNAVGTHTSLMDLANLDGAGGRRSRRHRRPRQQRRSTSARQTPTLTEHAENLTGEGGDVRLPTSVDVSVGASQVAVALSCEDGLAIELRFTIEKLSSLSRRTRHRAGRVVRLYDMRRPPCPRQLLRRRASFLQQLQRSSSGVAGQSSRRREQIEEGVREGASDFTRRLPSSSLPQQPRQLARKPASSPSSPMQSHNFSGVVSTAFETTSQHARSRRAGRTGRGGRRPTSIIYLPLPTSGPAMNGSTTSPLPPSLAAAGVPASASAFPQGHGESAKKATSMAASKLSAAAAAGSEGGSRSSRQQGLRSPSHTPLHAASENTAGQMNGPLPSSRSQQLQRSVLRTSSSPTSPLSNNNYHNSASVGDSSRGRRYEDHGVVLRAQCLWAARLGDSPLVQRARVFCVKDHHQDNTFCTVFVAANGTCFAIDGDTLSVVECSVKEDCSSFTLMAGPSSTMPMSLMGAVGGAGERERGDGGLTGQDRNSHVTHSGGGGGGGGGSGSNNSSPATAASAVINANLLRGAVGRTVSCVCVSVDELCIYSVGEANQLVQHRDAAATPAHVTSMPAVELIEPTSLLSRRLPNNPCNNTTAGQINSTHPSGDNPRALDGESATYAHQQHHHAPLPPHLQPHQANPLSWIDSVDENMGAMESEEKALLRLLAQRLTEQERHVIGAAASSEEGSSGSAAMREEESEEAMLLRMKRLLLHGYTDAEWDKLKWLDHGVT